jgi:hypothetical protein
LEARERKLLGRRLDEHHAQDRRADQRSDPRKRVRLRPFI